MAEVFYATRAGKSLNFASYVLHKFYALKNVRFYQSKHGKPYCDAPVFFSLTHTKRLIFLCVSRAETGIDAEESSRRGNFDFIKKKLSACERALADFSSAEFLKLWTRREATTKYLDIPVFSSFSRLTFEKAAGGDMRADATFPCFNGKTLPVSMFTLEIDGHYVSVCLAKGEKIEAVRFINNF